MKRSVVHLLFISQRVLFVYQESKKPQRKHEESQDLKWGCFHKMGIYFKKRGRCSPIQWARCQRVGKVGVWRRLWWECRSHTRANQETLHPWPPVYFFPSRFMEKFIICYFWQPGGKREEVINGDQLLLLFCQVKPVLLSFQTIHWSYH